MKNAVEELRRVYREQAIVHKNATESGDYRVGNRAHDKLYRAYYGLKDAGADRVLLELLDDSEAAVRGWAATHCLFINERKAKQELAALARGSGMIAFSAQMVLAQWKLGELGLAPRNSGAPQRKARVLRKRRRRPRGTD